MSSKVNQDPRIDPRIKAVLGSFAQPVASDVESREVKPYLAGLNDCVSGLEWRHANCERLNIDPGRIIVSGESGGGDRAIATTMRMVKTGQAGLIKGF